MELRQLVRNLYGIDQPQGCTEEEIAAVREIFGSLPAVVEDFWRTFGHTKELTRTDDTWFFPEDFQRWDHLAQSGILPLLDENQYVCEAAVLQKDLFLPDPPVYTRMAADEGPWVLSAPTTSEFLEAALTYEAIWQLKYSVEEYHWLTDEELAVVQAKLEKHPCVLKNWMDLEITFYSSRPDNLVVVMDADDHCEVLYGGNTEESYAALLKVMEGLGEPI
mgnify:CR=1 FL=1